jgi:hypothetical protein
LTSIFSSPSTVINEEEVVSAILAQRAVFTVLDNELLIVRLRGAGQPPLQADEMPLG